MADNQMEKMIIENVMKELAKRGMVGATAAPAQASGNSAPAVSEGAPLEVPDISGCWIPNP